MAEPADAVRGRAEGDEYGRGEHEIVGGQDAQSPARSVAGEVQVAAAVAPQVGEHGEGEQQPREDQQGVEAVRRGQGGALGKRARPMQARRVLQDFVGEDRQGGESAESVSPTETLGKTFSLLCVRHCV